MANWTVTPATFTTLADGTALVGGTSVNDQTADLLIKAEDSNGEWTGAYIQKENFKIGGGTETASGSCIWNTGSGSWNVDGVAAKIDQVQFINDETAGVAGSAQCKVIARVTFANHNAPDANTTYKLDVDENPASPIQYNLSREICYQVHLPYDSRVLYTFIAPTSAGTHMPSEINDFFNPYQGITRLLLNPNTFEEDGYYKYKISGTIDSDNYDESTSYNTLGIAVRRAHNGVAIDPLQPGAWDSTGDAWNPPDFSTHDFYFNSGTTTNGPTQTSYNPVLDFSNGSGNWPEGQTYGSTYPDYQSRFYRTGMSSNGVDCWIAFFRIKYNPLDQNYDDGPWNNTYGQYPDPANFCDLGHVFTLDFEIIEPEPEESGLIITSVTAPTQSTRSQAYQSIIVRGSAGAEYDLNLQRASSATSIVPASTTSFTRQVNQANSTTNDIIFDDTNAASGVQFGDYVFDSDGTTVHGTVTALDPNSDSVYEIRISNNAAITNNEVLTFVRYARAFYNFSSRSFQNSVAAGANRFTLDATGRAEHGFILPTASSNVRYDIFVEPVGETTARSTVPTSAGSLINTQSGLSTMTLNLTRTIDDAHVADGNSTRFASFVDITLSRPTLALGAVTGAQKHITAKGLCSSAVSSATRLTLEKVDPRITEGMYVMTPMVGPGIPHATTVSHVNNNVITLSAASTIAAGATVRFESNSNKIFPFTKTTAASGSGITLGLASGAAFLPERTIGNLTSSFSVVSGGGSSGAVITLRDTTAIGSVGITNKFLTGPGISDSGNNYVQIKSVDQNGKTITVNSIQEVVSGTRYRIIENPNTVGTSEAVTSSAKGNIQALHVQGEFANLTTDTCTISGYLRVTGIPANITLPINVDTLITATG